MPFNSPGRNRRPSAFVAAEMGLRVCMVGCGGFAALAHGPAQRRYAASHHDVELVACSDPDADRARQFGEATGYRAHYADTQAMLDGEKPDAVILAVPPTSTCRLAASILERGIPLLLEKPPGMNRSELDTLIDAANKSGASAQVAFNRHYMPVMQRASSIVRADFGAGLPWQLNYEMERCNRWDPDFSTTAIHAIDGALFLGGPLHTVNIRCYPQRRGELETASVLLDGESASGARILISIQPVSGRNAESVRIQALDQSLFLTLPLSPQRNETGQLEHWRKGEVVESYSDEHCEFFERYGIYGETTAFIDSVRSGSPVTPGLEDCGQAVALMEFVRLRRPGTLEFGAAGGPTQA